MGELISQWALSTYRTESSSILTGKYVEAAKALYNRAIKDAWNVDGAEGLVYTTDWEGNPVIHDRMTGLWQRQLILPQYCGRLQTTGDMQRIIVNL